MFFIFATYARTLVCITKAETNIYLFFLLVAQVLFELSADSFKAMLRFIYYGERQIEPLHATELIAFSKVCYCVIT